MNSYRPAAVANAFYPGNSALIETELDQYIHINHQKPPPKAMIVPHAGWRYSGACAGQAYGLWAERGAEVKRVILLGPAHKVGFVGLGVSSADYWSSPLGAYRCASDELHNLCAGQPYVNFVDIAHTNEHCLEVQLPFIMRVFPNAQLIPILVSQNGLEIAQQFLNHYWGGDETVILISSDLSHYTAPDICRQFDDETAQIIENRQIDQLNGKRACGYQAIGALLAQESMHNFTLERLHLCHSGDAIPADKVVGYGSWAIYNA